jgi:hypothetical protein
LGQHLATIDFETTTGLPAAVQAMPIEREKDLYERERELKRDHHVWLFRTDKRWLRPILDYPPGRNVIQSSVGQAVADVVRMRQQFRIGAFAAIIGALAVGATFMGVIVALAIGYWQVANDNTTLHKDLQNVGAQAQLAQQEKAQLSSCFTALDATVSSPSGLKQLPEACKSLK